MISSARKIDRSLEYEARDARDKLKQFMLDHPKWTLAAVSHDMLRLFKRGCSYPTLKAYMSGLYRINDLSPLESKIITWLDSQKGDPKRPFGYRPVEATKTIVYGCNLANENKKIVLLISKPGVGKSEGLREFCLNNDSINSTRVDCSQGMTPRGFLRALCDQMRISSYTDKHSTLCAVTDMLTIHPRLVIVDEGDFLTEESLNHIRYIWDHCSIGIVLVGTNELYESFTRNRKTAEARARLLSRISLIIRVPELALSEVTAIVTDYFGDEITPEIAKRFHALSSATYRELDNVMERIDMLRSTNPNAKFAKLLDMSATKMFTR